MPSDIQAPITLLIGTSIIVANSFTVTNSVTFKIFSCCSCSASSCSAFWRWVSRFSLRYLAPLDLVPFPCKRSRVSRTCFCTSSSVGSILVIILFFFSFFAVSPPLVTFTSSLRMRLRLRFSLSAVAPIVLLVVWASFSLSLWRLRLRFFFFFSNWLRSIFSPTTLGPVSFWYWVSITPIEISGVGSSLGLVCCCSFFLGGVVVCIKGFW